MQTATHHSPEVRLGETAPQAFSTQAIPVDFVPLHLETRTHVTTAVMCRHLSRAEQTARAWASAETYPEGLRPVRVSGRLAWPVAGIRKVLGVQA
ncbi:hypothetical protein [Rhizobacter fulvus]